MREKKHTFKLAKGTNLKVSYSHIREQCERYVQI